MNSGKLLTYREFRNSRDDGNLNPDDVWKTLRTHSSNLSGGLTGPTRRLGTLDYCGGSWPTEYLIDLLKVAGNPRTEDEKQTLKLAMYEFNTHVKHLVYEEDARRENLGGGRVRFDVPEERLIRHGDPRRTSFDPYRQAA